MRFNIILTEPTFNIVGGYKMAYIYANHLVQNEHDVILYYFSDVNNGKSAIKYLVKKIIMKLEPRWMKLDSRIKKKSIRNISNITIENAEKLIITASPLIKDTLLLDEKKGDKFQLIQDHEIWVLEENELFELYKVPLKRIAVSNWLKTLVDSYCSIPASLVTNGIDLSEFYVSNPIECRKKGSIVMLYHLNERKGVRRGLHILDRLKKEFPELHCVMFGSPKRGEDIAEWIEYRRNVNEYELNKIFNEASIFFCPSYFEGFGLTGLESMASGCTLVSSDTLGVKDYAINEFNALLSVSIDDEALYINLKRLIECDDLRIKLAKNGQMNIEEKSLEKSKSEFLKLFVNTHLTNRE